MKSVLPHLVALLLRWLLNIGMGLGVGILLGMVLGNVIVGFVVGMLTAIALILWSAPKTPRLPEQPTRLSPEEAQSYHRLLKQLYGDRAQVERLINYERSRLPQGNRCTWIQNAINRLEQDRR